MSTTYAQKKATAQKKDATTAASILDTSSQSESLQRKADMANSTVQREEAPRPNNTGMPDNLKSGIESLSGFSMDDVRVHYNSSKPATVQALAYTQGTDIHVAPGQEKHLPHEAWHVAQQMAGRVSPTTNINGMPVNDNAALEHEADVMGEKAVMQRKASICTRPLDIGPVKNLVYGLSPSTLSHSHIIFEGQDKDTNVAPFCNNYRNCSDSTGNNVGFHCKDGSIRGKGEYFSEDLGDKEYTEQETLYDDDKNKKQNKVALMNAILIKSTSRNYSLWGYNCHSWAEEVKRAYQEQKNKPKRD